MTDHNSDSDDDFNNEQCPLCKAVDTLDVEDDLLEILVCTNCGEQLEPEDFL